MKDCKLVEYETLRTEIIEERKSTNFLFIYGLIAAGGLFAYAAQTDTGALYLIPLVVLLPTLLLMYYNDVRTLEKASYILVFHEAETSDLQWETTVFLQRNNRRREKSIYGKWWGPTIVGRQMPYFSLGIACLLLSYVSWGRVNTALWALVAIATTAFELILYVLQVRLPNRQEKLVQLWKFAKAHTQATSDES
ncbi:hypothetical protein KAX17_12100 [Candidatus Bipolaricaulota bacterium]|nr:hypothetical protein [Candidatus Bipolaricaulota bacterium]